MKTGRLGLCLSVLIICLFTIISFKGIQKPTEQDIYLEVGELSYLNNKIVATGMSVDKLMNVDVQKVIVKDLIKEEVEVTPEEQPDNTEKKVQTQVKKEQKTEKVVEKVYNNMTMEELSAKLNKSLNSTLSNTGHLFAKYSIKYGVNPYLAVAISLHETGCKWDCSTLVKQCNNVGGQKGSPGCGGGSYKYFSTLEEGIHNFIYNIYNNYYKYGLTTPELMNPKYAESTTWATQVNAYITSIKNN